MRQGHSPPYPRSAHRVNIPSAVGNEIYFTVTYHSFLFLWCFLRMEQLLAYSRFCPGCFFSFCISIISSGPRLILSVDCITYVEPFYIKHTIIQFNVMRLTFTRISTIMKYKRSTTITFYERQSVRLVCAVQVVE